MQSTSTIPVEASNTKLSTTFKSIVCTHNGYIPYPDSFFLISTCNLTLISFLIEVGDELSSTTYRISIFFRCSSIPNSPLLWKYVCSQIHIWDFFFHRWEKKLEKSTIMFSDFLKCYTVTYFDRSDFKQPKRSALIKGSLNNWQFFSIFSVTNLISIKSTKG